MGDTQLTPEKLVSDNGAFIVPNHIMEPFLAMLDIGFVALTPSTHWVDTNIGSIECDNPRFVFEKKE
jgi:hypothetical protein